jgi:hypothetical protein
MAHLSPTDRRHSLTVELLRQVRPSFRSSAHVFPTDLAKLVADWDSPSVMESFSLQSSQLLHLWQPAFDGFGIESEVRIKLDNLPTSVYSHTFTRVTVDNIRRLPRTDRPRYDTSNIAGARRALDPANPLRFEHVQGWLDAGFRFSMHDRLGCFYLYLWGHHAERPLLTRMCFPHDTDQSFWTPRIPETSVLAGDHRRAELLISSFADAWCMVHDSQCRAAE